MARTLAENLARQLCDSIDRLEKQVESVQFWAAAVRGATAPVPDFQPDDDVLARVVRPTAEPAKTHRRRVARRRRRAS
jgi:hypothetical protein